MTDKLKLAVFASHGGSNLQSIIDASRDPDFPAEVALVVSNNLKAFALTRAGKAGIPTVVWQKKKFADAKAYVDFILEKLREHGIDLICLAGYMKLIPSELIRQYRIINIHPALLPKYGGKGMYGIHVHEAVLEAGEDATGVTIHQVNEKYDQGKILNSCQVAVSPDDNPESLQKKVLEFEHKLYPETIAKIAKGEITLDE
ncbi:MAG: phosphoribosylglycinamide formyltransferase [candidate division Zixibacteria bacterium]|nr:phosphoribosylglycinamide formyltransferase [candidate division Zixibacteria bacterium]